MSKPFAVFDIDGTLFRSSLLIEFVWAAIDSGVFSETARNQIEDTYTAWKQRAHKNAYEDYIDTVVEVYLNHMKGVSKVDVDRISRDLAKSVHKETYVYTRELVQSLKQTHTVVAISGSTVDFLEPFVKEYRFDIWKGSELEIINGKYTGEELRKGHHKKDQTLKEIVKEYSLTYQNSYGVGDTGPDIPMLELVANPIAFNPSRELFEHAKKSGWKIVVERKNMIYNLVDRDGDHILEVE